MGTFAYCLSHYGIDVIVVLSSLAIDLESPWSFAYVIFATFILVNAISWEAQ